MDSFNLDQAARSAADLLKDSDVAEVLALIPEEASRLALAVVADADIAPELAADLIHRHAAAIEALECATMNATARPEYEGSRLVVSFQLDETTRKCLRLISALKMVAAQPKSRRAA
jgi:hypothetical protein